MDKKITIIGGGVGSSTFTKSLLGLPVELSTVVSSFDDGGSTGSIRRDYGGIALGDFRQCLIASLECPEIVEKSLQYRFGGGSLYGINVGNILLRSFLDNHGSERQGILRLHELLKLKNLVVPVSYTFSRLHAELDNARILRNQAEVAEYLSFVRARISKLYLNPKARLGQEAKAAILKSGILAFAPGNFFTSVLPHLYVEGFAESWKKSKAYKVWFVNLLAHKGQDSMYTLRNYLSWFQKSLGRKPFDAVVVNKQLPRQLIGQVADRFAPLQITRSDIQYIKGLGIKVFTADLVSRQVRQQAVNDTVFRAPVRHDVIKIRKFFNALLQHEKTYNI